MSVPTPRATTGWRVWRVVAVVLLYAVALQGVRPLYSPDEGRYTDVALIMLHSGDWLHPMLHPAVAHWAKPPLAHWAIAASFAVFGEHVLATRLPGALAFAFTILLMIRLGRRFVPAQPWLPALVYASFVLPSLADAITAQLNPAPHEVAFVAAGARYGLRSYLGSQVEELGLRGDPSALCSQDLASGSNEHEGCRLLLARPLRGAELERELTDLGATWRRLDDVRGYSAFASLSHDCAWRNPSPGNPEPR